ncbi:hypothetical protein R5O87_21160, partial [Arthrobacter globiformis]|uniref:DUF5134 domain-containing protein n=1 Tax=Arthrobacter globiformis TaxID=1665 RepID=UPI00397E2CB6
PKKGVIRVFHLPAMTWTLTAVLLAGGALWFIIQAVARPEYKLLCAGTQGRIKCAYHALTMTGAALMITLMTHPASPTNGQTATPMPAGHHAINRHSNNRANRTTTTPAQGAAPPRTEHALETLSATTMALMFATTA